MNKAYRIVWSEARQDFMVAHEKAKARGKSCRSAIVCAVLAALFVADVALAEPPAPDQLPTGGQIVAGSGTIAGAGAAMTVTQATDRMIANWQSFDIGANASVAFVQPSASSMALNRVLNQAPSQIFGRLSANGQVMLVNPAGIVFGRGSQVDVGALVASTLAITDANFMAGNYRFAGGGAGSILNQGRLATPAGGAVALIAPVVRNEGDISTPKGTTLLAAGNAVTVDFKGDGLLSYTLDAGAAKALAEHSGAIDAGGGVVVLTAKAANAVAEAVVNNTGIVQARTLASRSGRILLLSDSEVGQTNVSGTLDASAPSGGDGGFVETSGGRVKISDGARINRTAPYGQSGTWLIDPPDFTIAASGGDISGATLGTNLAGGPVTIQSAGGASGTNGDVNVNDMVSWSANQLTLSAFRNVNINQNLTGSGTAKLALQYGQGAVAAGNTADYIIATGKSVTLPAGANFSTKLGSDGATTNYTVITALGNPGSITGTDLQGMNGGLNGNYALGADIDASETSGWNGGAGFAPVGTFSGTFTGLGHTITNLSINRPGTDFVGLFGVNAGVVRNVGLVGGTVSGSTYVGGLVGDNRGTLSNSYATGAVSGSTYVGGLVGENVFGTVTNSYATGAVSGTGQYVGGLAGGNFRGMVSNSYATGAVSGTSFVGGLAGDNFFGTVTNSYATGAVSGTGANVGGLVGDNRGTLSNSYATGAVSGTSFVGGLAGVNAGTLSNSYATGTVSGIDTVGGLVGFNSGTVSNSYATGAVSGIDTVGGLVGYNYGTVSNSYATGAVSGRSRAGGLVGFNYGTVSNSYWDTTSSGMTTGIGGGTTTGTTGLTSAQAMMQARYTGFDFASTWRIYEGNTRPLLKVFLTPLTVTANNATATYNGTTSFSGLAVTYSVAGAGSSPNLLGSLTLTSGTKNVGTTTLTGGGLYSNQQGFDISFINGTLMITKANLGVTGLTATPRVYDATTEAPLGGVARVTGLLTDQVSVAGVARGSFATKDVGTGKAVTVTGTTLSGADAGNYTLVQQTGLTADITTRGLSVTANSLTKTFDGVPYRGVSGVIYSGFVSGETEAVLGGTLAFGGSSQGAVNPGSYVIAPGGLTSGNYAFVYLDGTLTIGAPAQPYIPPPEPRNPLTSLSQPSFGPIGGPAQSQPLITFDVLGGEPPDDESSP